MTAIAVVSFLVGASSALARAIDSTNWAGYAIHGTAEAFRQVAGVWREPSATCRPGRQTFSSYWVGIGGYSASSRALEQTGTEVDCTAQGHVRAFAWFELVPAPSIRVKLRVPPGDLIQGAVTVTGHQVRMSLQDLTRHANFSRVLHARRVDASSAEWIVEAPSECLGNGHCFTLPLANFGSTRFNGAQVRPASGQAGPISDARWRSTEIKLVPRDQRFVANHPGLGAGGRAAPSRLERGGSAFNVSYAPLARRGAAAASAAVLADGRLVHRATIWLR